MSIKSLIRYGLTLVILSSVGGLALIWTRLSVLESHYVHAENVRALEKTIQSLYADAAQKTVSARTLILDPKNTRAPGNFDKAAEAVETAFKDFERIAEEEGLTPQFADRIQKLRETTKENEKISRGMFALGMNGQTAEATEKMKKEENPIWRGFRDEILVLRADVGKLADEKSQFARAEAARQKTVIIVLSLLIATIAAAVYFFAHRLLKQLTVEIEGLREAADVASESSESLTRTSEELSSSSTHQASALQQTAASLEQISRMVANNSENATVLERAAGVSERTSRESQDAVHKMSEAIQHISQSNGEIIREIENSNREIEDIVKIISDIGSKTKVINDIVFQTKLLSFNASVEAARAGEAGKGFSVVAEEVGKLAEVSGNSAKEISSLLEQSTQRVRSIVESTQGKLDRLGSSGRQRVEEGVQTVQLCSRMLDEVVKNVSESGRMVKDISDASVEQSKGVEEISKAMRSLDDYANKNAGASGETSESARKMREQSEALKRLLGEVTRTVQGSNKAA